MVALGIYRCSACRHSWASAYATKKTGQLCKECRKYTRPHRLITKNPARPTRRRHQAHRSDLCIACIKGVCRFSKNKSPLPTVVGSVIDAIGL